MLFRSAIAPMVVHAEPTVYGHGQVEYASFSGANTGIAMTDNARGRVGVKNAEDLGNGMMALFKAEFQVDFADGEVDEGNKVDEAVVDADCNGDGDKTDTAACTIDRQTLSKREMMIGLKAGFGQIEVGRLKSPYKYTGGIKYDPYVTTVHEARGVVMSGAAGNNSSYGHNGFISEAVSYLNNFGSLQIWVLHSPDTGGPDVDNAPKGTVAAITYQKGSIHAFVKNVTDGVTGEAEYKATAYGTKIKFGGVDIALQAEKSERNNIETDYLFVNLNSILGNNIFTLNYGTKETGTDDTTKTTVAVAHKFSKKTRVWVGHTNVDDTAGNYSVTSMGLRVDI